MTEGAQGRSSTSARVAAYLRQNVLGLIAIFIAATGTTYAASNLPHNSAGTRNLAKGAVTTSKIRKHAVTGIKVAPHTLTADNLDLSTLPFQQRVSGTCTGGSAIDSIDAGGGVGCASAGGPPSGPAGNDLAGAYPNPSINTATVQRRVNSSCNGYSAIQSIDAVGGVGCTAGSASEELGGSTGQVSGTNILYLAGSGLSAPNTDENAVSVGFSLQQATLQGLYVVLPSAPGPPGEWFFQLRVNGNDTGVGCGLETVANCNSGALGVQIPPGATVDLQAVPSGNPPPERVTFGWLAVPST